MIETVKTQLGDHEHTTLVLTSEFIQGNRHEFRDTVLSACSSARGDVALDLTGVAYLDTRTLGTFVSAAKRCRDRGRELWLKGLGVEVRTLLELTKLDRFFRVEGALPT